jgi:hypothetical protein
MTDGFTLYKKINYVTNEHIMKSHRSGWRYVSGHLSQLHNPYGLLFYSWADRVLKVERNLRRKWSGFLHNVISYPQKEYPLKYKDIILPLDTLVNQNWFHDSLEKCQGIFTLSAHTKKFLENHIKVPVVNLTHPSVIYENKFNMDRYASDKSLVHVGQWMRKYHSFLNLNCSHRKTFINTEAAKRDFEEMKQYGDDSNVTYLFNLNNRRYDSILTKSVVFLDFYDVVACNTVIECIMMNIPIVTTRLAANLEYLGEDYPLFFDNLEEASAKLKDDDLIEYAHLYLKKMDKRKFGIDKFMDDLCGSSIYRDIPMQKIM